MGKFVCELYNNGEDGWFHVLPVESIEATPLLSQHVMAQIRHGDTFKNIFPYNNSWWAIVKAETVTDAVVIFSDIYRKEVYSKEFIRVKGDEDDQKGSN